MNVWVLWRWKFVAGFGDSGTLSFKLALEPLGIASCYHTLEVAINDGHDAASSG